MYPCLGSRDGSVSNAYFLSIFDEICLLANPLSKDLDIGKKTLLGKPGIIIAEF